jgi:hypothetical protein
MADLNRIKANVAKMASMNAPEADIDGYIASEGVGVDDVRNHQMNVNQDALTAGLIGKIGQGATFNLADEFQGGFMGGAKYAGNKIARQFSDNVNPVSLGEAYNQELGDVRGNLDYAQQEAPVQSGALQLGGALITGGLGASGKTGTAIANSLRGGNLAARIGKAGVAAAPAGYAFGFGEGEGGLQNRTDLAGKTALVSSLVAGAIPGVAGTVKGVANAVVPQIESSTAKLALRAKDFGIPLRVDQLSPTRARNTVQKVSQEIPFSGVNAFEDTQKAAVQKALAKTIGEDADNLGPDVINNYLKGADTKFRAAIGSEPVRFDPVTVSRFDDIYKNADVTEDVANIIKKNVDRFKADLSGDYINPVKLASFRSDLIKKIPKADSQARPYLHDIIDTIDDIAEKSLPEENAAILSQARREYRNFKTIEPLLEKSPDGNINPTELINRVAASPYIKASRNSLGEDDLVDLARISKKFLPIKGGSDTVQKGLYLGAGASLMDPTAATIAGGTIGANAVYQRGYNQSQGLVDAILRKAAAGGKVSPAEIGKLPPSQAQHLLNKLKTMKISVEDASPRTVVTIHGYGKK